MLGIVDDTEEKSQRDQVVTASKPSKPLLTYSLKDIVPVHAIFTKITTWFSLSRGQIVKISI